MKHLLSLTVRLLTAAVLLGCSNAALASNLIVELDNELLSIQAEDVSLIEIANLLTDVIGIPVTYTKGSDKFISVNIVEEPIRVAVSKLSDNTIVVTRRIEGKETIAEIMLLLDQSDASNAGQLDNTGLEASEQSATSLQVAAADEENSIKAEIYRIAQLNAVEGVNSGVRSYALSE